MFLGTYVRCIGLMPLLSYLTMGGHQFNEYVFLNEIIIMIL